MRTRFPTLLKRAARPSEPDAELVRRFAATGDQAAFAELVRRYGRLVWGQCRHLLPSEADADDAFQATFLALAKSVKTVRHADRLGPFLHGVAYRVCQNARRLAARRKKRERGSAANEAVRPVADSAWDSALAAVHDELHRLPEPLRVAFVLCCLEGKGVSEAADQLGLKLGTFSARLTRAKQALLDRLTARGLTAGVVALAAVTGGAATAPAKVLDRAVELVTAGSAAVPANILSLTHGVLGMATWNVKLLAAAVLVAGGLTAGFGGAFSAHAQDAPKEKAAKDDKDKVIEDLKRALKEQEVQTAAERQKASAEQTRQRLMAERERARAEKAESDAQIKKDAPAKKPAGEFKYLGQSATFAPTPDELEALVKKGEEGGYKFVGINTMKGTGKGDGAVPTLVFRKAKLVEVRTDAVLDKGLKELKELEGLDLKKDFGDLQKGGKLDDLKKGLDRDAAKLGDLKKGLELEAKNLKQDAEAKMKKLEAEAKEKVKEQQAKADEQAKAAKELAAKAADAAKKKAADEERAKSDAPRKAVDAATDEKAKVQAEIEALRAKIAAMEKQTAKKPATMTAKIAAADLGKGDRDANLNLLTELVRSKFGADGVKRFSARTDAKDKSVWVVEGDPEVITWLKDAVKLLRSAPAKGKDGEQ